MNDFMKRIAFLLLLPILFFSFDSTEPKGEVSLQVKLGNCDFLDSVYLYRFNGVSHSKIKAVATQPQVEFKVPAGSPRFYYFGAGGYNLRPVLLGPEKEVVMKANCKSFRSALVEASDLNKEYDKVKKTLNDQKIETSKLMRQYQGAMNNDQHRDLLVHKFGQLDERKKKLLDSLRAKDPYLGKVVAINTYLSYQANGGTYENEVDYFVNEFFKQVDWSDEDYEQLPWVYEKWKEYTEVLANLRMPKEKLKEILDIKLSELPKDKHTYKLALGGVVMGLNQKQNPNYVPFAEEFITRYRTEEPEATDGLKKKVDQIKAFSEGGEAPNFTQANTDGEDVSLTDFRGKVLLVDFWASWCGPCRRENPNVVKMYNKYKEQGFDVLGVSLDNQKQRWLSAIEQDGLEWHHVSDLKGWKNEVAVSYGVRSIPHTVLLDREGRIIARNLRGGALETKLAEIFGE
jgi:peroxiredoxin